MVFKKKQPKTEGIVVGGSNRKLNLANIKKLKDIDYGNKKKIFVATIISVIIIIVSSGMYFFQQISINNKIKKQSNKISCNTDLEFLKDASQNLSLAKRKNLEPYAIKIESYNGYRSNPNCIIPVLAYYLYQGTDQVKIGSLMNDFEKNYDNVNIYPFFKNQPNYLERFKVEYEGVKIRSKELEKNKIRY